MTVTYILSCDSIVVKVVKRKVTQPDEELRTIPPSPFVLKGVLSGAKTTY